MRVVINRNTIASDVRWIGTTGEVVDSIVDHDVGYDRIIRIIDGYNGWSSISLDEKLGLKSPGTYLFIFAKDIDPLCKCPMGGEI